MKVFKSSSPAATKKFAEALVKRILNCPPAWTSRPTRFATRSGRASLRSRADKSKILNYRGAVVVALTGDLGSGKTTFAQGFFRGLGIRKRATSPTFILMRRVAIRRIKNRELRFKNIYHVDTYRVKKPKELLQIGFKEILKNPENIVLIEWAERMKDIIPRGAFWIRFSHGKKANERKICF